MLNVMHRTRRDATSDTAGRGYVHYCDAMRVYVFGCWLHWRLYVEHVCIISNVYIAL